MLDCPAADREDLKGGEPAYNAEAIMAVLGGAKGPFRDAVILSAAGALLVAGRAGSLREGAGLAAQSIDSGAARAALARLVEITNRPAAGMSDVLAEICAVKRQHVARRQAELPLARLLAELPTEAPRGFARALTASGRDRPAGADRRDQESLAQQGLDPGRFRPACPRPGLRRRRRCLPVGADRRAVFPGA